MEASYGLRDADWIFNIDFNPADTMVIVCTPIINRSERGEMQNGNPAKDTAPTPNAMYYFLGAGFYFSYFL